MQRDFARLVTSPVARERFAREPHAEAPSLASLASMRVTFFANALLAKRLHELRRLLPSAEHVRDLRARFIAHAATFTPGGPGRHREDAIVFARTLERMGVPGARCDRLTLEAGRGARLFAIGIEDRSIRWWMRPSVGARLRTGRVRLPRG